MLTKQRSTSSGSVKKTRPAPKSHKLWVPHHYQEKGVEHLVENPVAALFFDPGLGKTSISLEAFRRLQEKGVARKMLVVAPLRVCQLVWRQEGQEWTQFRHLRFSLVHGTPKQKAAALEADADIYLVNPEGIPWLTKQFGFGRRRWPFDTLCIDELTKFKNSQAQRHKKFREYAWKSSRRWGLTGTPIPNGYMDLFGQIMILDEGRALGVYITRFRDRFFDAGYTGFDFALRKDAGEKIEELIRPYVLRMSAEDWLELPELVPDPRMIELTPAQLKLYRELKREMTVELEEQGITVTAENSGGIHSKLKQMANGAVYIERNGKREFIKLHDLKLDALEELREELQGQQLLVGYEFQHDLARLLERFPDTPYLAGASDKQAQDIEERWNAGEIQMLFAHPASAGHGLNFQKSSAGHVCWFSVTIDLELYEQFLKRILRQGNKRASVINHALVVKDTVDELSKEQVEGKAVTQARFLQALRTELNIEQGDDDMTVKKLRRKAEVEETEETTAPKKKGWGRKPSEEEDGDDDEEAPAPRRIKKAEAVKSRLAGDDDDDDDDDDEEAPAPRRGFSKAVRDRIEEDEDGEEEDDDDGEEEAPKPPLSRAPAKKPAPEPEEAPEDDDEPPFDGAVPRRLMSVDDPAYRRERALELSAQFAEKLGLRSAAEAVKAAKAFEEYIKG